MRVEVTTHYLETTSRSQIRGRAVDPATCQVAKVDPPSPELSRFFYTAVGGDWFWVDRLPWTYQQWLDDVGRPNRETWILSMRGVPAGYYELELAEPSGVEIVYFGLLPASVGKGLGGAMLTHALHRGWDWLEIAPQSTARRVWLHTCSLDHAVALANYQARGLTLYKTEVEEKELPERPIGPWPGAR
jgi:GNAT superfamily N-acetyltransferase